MKNIIIALSLLTFISCTSNKERQRVHTTKKSEISQVEIGKIVSLPSGLKYKVLKEGLGKKPKANDKVRVHYHGTLEDGKVFDSSIDRGKPIVFGVNQVIKGWQEGLQLMKEGAVYELIIPSKLGYGSQGAGKIPPFSTLIFKVELLEVL